MIYVFFVIARSRSDAAIPLSVHQYCGIASLWLAMTTYSVTINLPRYMPMEQENGISPV